MFDDYKYLILTHGVPGSGKSTFVANCFENRSDTNIICPDNLREEFNEYKEEWGDNFEYEIWKRVDERLKKSLVENRITVLDATFIHRQAILRQYKTMNQIDPTIKFIIVDFSDLSLEHCLENNRKRRDNGGRFVPEDVIEKMYNKIKRTKLLEFEPMTISHKTLEVLMK